MSDPSDAFDLDCYFSARKRWEPALDAWAHNEPAERIAISESSIDGPLAGVPFGVKDVIDVAGQPTRFGSNAFADAVAAEKDAPVVAALRAKEAIPVGKTRSTEFAFIDPTTTRNPYGLAHSPGGSSSGSGAVVGAQVVPFALGTQTAGSLCRPATYCGALSYKPGLGVLPQTGMAPLSHSFDAIGVIAQSPAWLGRVFDVLADYFHIPVSEGEISASALKIGLVHVPEQTPDAEMRDMMGQVSNLFRNLGHRVDDIETPVSFTDVITDHRTVMLHDMARNLGPVVSARELLLQKLFRASLLQGAEITSDLRDQAMTRIEEVQNRFWEGFSAFDLLLAYPVPGAAPKGLNTTGDQSYLTPWTSMAGPLVSLPAGQNPEGLPLGILLAAQPGRDRFLVNTATQLAGVLPTLTKPLPPS